MKIPLKVNADFDLSGKIMPRSIEWEDGRVFAVDRVIDVRRAASLKAGGTGLRYICRICGRTVALFNDENKWFMEKGKIINICSKRSKNSKNRINSCK